MKKLGLFILSIFLLSSLSLAKVGDILKVIKTPGPCPTGLAFDGKNLWLADAFEDKIYKIDLEKGTVLKSFESPGHRPEGLAWDGKYLWHIDYENDEIYNIKVFCTDIASKWDERQLSLQFIKEFRNYGPGTVKTLDIYLPIPENRDNQILLEPVQFEPRPAEIIEDSWGQKIAHFTFKDLKGYSIVKPGWKVKAKIYSTEYFIYPDKVGSLDEIPSEIKNKYLQDGDKYRIHDPFIQELAKKIAGNEKNPYWIARRVYDFLGSHLTYNLKPLGGWNPAPTVLRRGTSSCSEYSFSMIALCRSLGVPIRYVGAVSLRGDEASTDDTFHRWTEVYLPPYGWIPFDANKGDVDSPGGKVLGIGNVDARYIITTENGGGDKYLWFGYNYAFNWTSEDKCRISEENYGLWSPLGEKKYHKPIKDEKTKE